VSEARALAGEEVFVVGGGNSAGQAAMHLARFAERVTLLVRGASLAASMSSYLRDAIAAADNVEVQLQTEVVGGGGEERLAQLALRDAVTGEIAIVPAAGLFVLIGAEPHTAWLPEVVERDAWGYVLTGANVEHWPLERDPLMLETSLPGLFAVGDVRVGSAKRVASSVGEGSVVIRQVYELLEGEIAHPRSVRSATRG
jgi:thioredoxin reductase (NADPH)